MPASYRACLIDALGTTVRLLPPWERIDPRTVEGVPTARIEAAFRAEMAYYRAHAEQGRDAESLAQLRSHCATLLSRSLDRPIGVTTMMDAIAFEAYPDALPALRTLRERGLRVVCVSNWDYELPAVLERIGLASEFDGVVTSAGAGTRKPDPAIFEQALRIAGCDASEAFHVGDGSEDVEGARAAGIDVFRIDREGGGDVSSLAEIVSAPPPSSPPPSHPQPSVPPPTGGPPAEKSPPEGNFLTRYVGLPETGWRGMSAAIGVLIAAVVMITGTIMVAIFDPRFNTTAGKDAAQLMVALSLGGTAIGFALFAARGRVREAFEKLGLGGRVALSAIGLAGLAWFAYIIFAAVLTPLLQPDQQDVTRELGTNKDSIESIAVTAFLIVIAAPISEEMFFRGFMFASLRGSMSLWPAALISAAVWGSLHLSGGNIGVAVQLAVFGIILAWLYERSGTLWATILAHTLNNTIAFILLLHG